MAQALVDFNLLNEVRHHLTVVSSSIQLHIVATTAIMIILGICELVRSTVCMADELHTM